MPENEKELQRIEYLKTQVDYWKNEYMDMCRKYDELYNKIQEVLENAK